MAELMKQIVVLEVTYDPEPEDSVWSKWTMPRTQPADWKWADLLDEPEVKVIAHGPCGPCEDV